MPKNVVIVGAGVSGLTAAYRLRSLGVDASIQVLEASEHIGGLIRTERADGFVVEHGPESILTAKSPGRDLALELGLEADLQGTRQHVGGAFIVKRGALVRIPDGFSLMAPSALRPFLGSPLLSWTAKMRVLAEPWVPVKTDSQDESLAAFVRRRLGDEVLERIAQPMIGGIYGADPETLSLAASMPRFIELEHKYGSLVRGLRKQRAQNVGAAGARYKLFFSFRNGMQTLTDALANSLNDCISTKTPVTALRQEDDGTWLVTTSDATLAADVLVLAVSAPVASKLLADSATSLSQELAAIEYGRGAAVTLAYDRRAIAHPMDAYGFVVPSVEDSNVIACTFLHQKWRGRAPGGKALLRAFVVDKTTEHSDATLAQIAHAELARWLEISGPPTRHWVSRYSPSTPHYKIGHRDRVDAILSNAGKLPNLFLTGNAYRGVGIPDSIALADKTAHAIAAQLGC